jgi:KDO2-lipid IV(A) lauroyltransferase
MPRSVLGERAIHLGRRLPWLPPLLLFVEACWLRGLLALFALLPAAIASRVGAALLRRLGPLLPKSAHVARNLAFLRAAGVAPVTVADAWANVGHLLAEYPHFARIVASGMRIVVDPAAQPILGAGGRVVFVSAHVGSLEVAAAAIDRLGVRVDILYTPQSNPYLERTIQRYRGALGVRFLSRERALRAWLRGDARTSCGLATDQRVDDGELLPLFGVPALTSTTPAKLALRLGAPIVPLRAVREGPARYRVEFEAPIGADDVTATTLALQRRFEHWIAEHPGQWLCTKRRWPRDTPVPAAPQPAIGAPPAVRAAAPHAAGPPP